MSAMIVPKGWEIKRLDDLTAFIKDGTHGTHADVENGIPLLSAKDIENGNILLENNPRLISVEDYSQIHKKYAIEEGDILLTVVGTIGRLAIVKTKKTFTLQRSVAIIRSSKTTSNIFLYCAMQSERFLNQLLLRTNASAQGGIYLGELAKCTLPCPQDSAEQHKIATILSTLDHTIEATQKLIDKEKMVKKGLMADLLTHGIDEQGRIRSPQTHAYVDGIPEEWESKRICELGNVIGGGTPSRDVEEFWKNGTIFWATPTDITKEKTGKYIHETKECISEIGLSSSSAKLLPSNSILLTSRATIGEMRINSKPMTTNQGFTPILPFDNVEFLYYLLHMYVANMRRRAYGTTFPEISRTEVKNIFVSLPKSPKEQQRITTILSAQDRKIETEETNLAKLQNLKKGLMGDLLSGDVRVRV